MLIFNKYGFVFVVIRVIIIITTNYSKNELKFIIENQKIVYMACVYLEMTSS